MSQTQESGAVHAGEEYIKALLLGYIELGTDAAD